jgi:hypothetical protein
VLNARYLFGREAVTIKIISAYPKLLTGVAVLLIVVAVTGFPTWMEWADESLGLVSRLVMAGVGLALIFVLNFEWAWPRVLFRFTHEAPVRISPVGGQWLDTDTDGACIRARLVVRNTGPMAAQACTARIVSVECVGTDGDVHPLVPHTREFGVNMLRWDGHDDESVTIPEGSSRKLLLAETPWNRDSAPAEIRFCEHGTQDSLGPGWYKVLVAVTSKTEGIQASYTYLLLGWTPREGSVPAPVEIYTWEPWGERLTSHLRKPKQQDGNPPQADMSSAQAA